MVNPIDYEVKNVVSNADGSVTLLVVSTNTPVPVTSSLTLPAGDPLIPQAYALRGVRATWTFI